MFLKIKVWILRIYYRFVSARGWKGHITDAPYSTLQIPTDADSISARVYANNGGKDKPLLVYFHGGGWVIGDLDTHHAYCQALSERSGCTVVAVNYRLAPEHPFPAAADDSLETTRWLANHLDQLGPSNGTLVIAGDSAGANLTISTCLELDTDTRAKVVGEIVKYPAVDHYSTDYPSYTERARGQMLTRGLMNWFWDTYLGPYSAEDPMAKRAMPLRADNLASLPPTFLITAEFDPLRDEGIAFAQKLREAGVPLQYRHFDTAAHGFACSEGPNDNFNVFMNDLVTWLEVIANARAA
jgi:acetyl esterase